MVDHQWRTWLQYSHRQAIAGKLTQGVTTQHILDSIRDSVQGKFERIHYTTRKNMKDHLVFKETKGTTTMPLVSIYG